MAIATCCGSAAVTACCASTVAAYYRGSVVVAARCGPSTAAAPREPSLTAVVVPVVARDALDERRLVGTAASDLSTLAGVRGGTVGATL
jgi:ribosomal protein L5